MMSNLDISKKIIEDFCTDTSAFILVESQKKLLIKGSATNKVFLKKESLNIDLKINFIDSENSVVFLGANLKGNATITIKGSDSFIYIGNDCTFKKLIIDSNQKSDFIAIGNHVTTNFDCAFRSGLRATKHEIDSYADSPGIIIGDDCMFAADCLVRSSDAHPILEYPSLKHLNESISSVVIEEHVWIARNASILKNTTIGANSIIALDTVVTKDIPKYSVAKGTPMRISSFKGRIWQRAFTKKSENLALKYYKKYEHTAESSGLNQSNETK
ncbi:MULTISPECIES: acyltransferase [unclassified Psychrobacter]|uniref:acyltransferase n=1 Tax=unclassified Psychrobacter TaxID=196806 RepID=UPI003F9C2DFB